MGTNKPQAGAFHSLEPQHLTLKHSLFSTDDIFTVLGSLARKLLPHTELMPAQLLAFMSQSLQKAWEKTSHGCDKL